MRPGPGMCCFCKGTCIEGLEARREGSSARVCRGKYGSFELFPGRLVLEGCFPGLPPAVTWDFVPSFFYFC